jgi:hypothetical protein
VNGDGHLDLVATVSQMSGDETLAVLLGRGDGSFGPQIDHQFGVRFPDRLVLKDVNGDGRADLICRGASTVAGGVGVFLANEDGTFAAPEFHDFQASEFADVVDIDGDGHLDIVGFRAILFGLESGGFRGPAAYEVNAVASSGSAVADVDLDGDLDILGLNSLFSGDSTVYVQRQMEVPDTGRFEFDPNLNRLIAVGTVFDDRLVVSLDSSVNPTQVVAELSWMDSSGNPRMASARANAVTLSGIDFRTGWGVDEVVTGPALPAALQPRRLAPFDLTEYAHPDSGFARRFAVGDADGDGDVDLVTMSSMTATLNQLSIILNDGAGAFDSRTSFTVGPGSDALALADVNGDGILDIVTSQIEVFLGAGDGAFLPGAVYAVPEIGDAPPLVEDLDSDGDLDLLIQGTSAVFPRLNRLIQPGGRPPAGQPLLAPAPRPESLAPAEALTPALLEPSAAEATDRSSAAAPSADAAGRRDGVRLQIVDLPGDSLGRAGANSVLIDADATVYGWFLDASSGEDEEFPEGVTDWVFRALGGSPVQEGVDLLTVWLHEFGHLRGCKDTDAQDFMGSLLAPGERRLPHVGAFDACFAGQQDFGDASRASDN